MSINALSVRDLRGQPGYAALRVAVILTWALFGAAFVTWVLGMTLPWDAEPFAHSPITSVSAEALLAALGSAVTTYIAASVLRSGGRMTPLRTILAILAGACTVLLLLPLVAFALLVDIYVWPLTFTEMWFGYDGGGY